MKWRQLIGHRNAGTELTISTEPEDKRGFCHTVRSVSGVQDSETVADPLRWRRFIALCIADGVTESEVQAMFREQDIGDLCLSSDAALLKMAATIVGAIKREPKRIRKLPSKAPSRIELRRCGQCQHYTLNPTTGSTGLGWCNQRDDVSMAVPWRLIECEDFKDD